MPGLSFSNQSQNRRSGLWLIPIVLIVISVMLITLCVRFGNSGPFAVARGVVQTVTQPIAQVWLRRLDALRKRRCRRCR